MFFKEQIKKRIKNEKGLTLIELLAVIVILAIIAAIAIPAIGNIINNSRDKAIVSEAINIISGAKLAKIDQVCGDGKTAVTGKNDTGACTNTTPDISKYVEGASTDIAFSAYYDGKDWKITFADFKNIKNTTDYNFNETAEYTESALKASIDK